MNLNPPTPEFIAGLRAAAAQVESEAYRALVHQPPCPDAVVHTQRVLAAVTGLPDLEEVAQLIVDTRNDECDAPSIELGLVECE